VAGLSPTEAYFQERFSPCEIVVRKVVLGQDFLTVFRF
jgi:hypothetical protein